jgi:hypothetical protein
MKLQLSLQALLQILFDFFEIVQRADGDQKKKGCGGILYDLSFDLDDGSNSPWLLQFSLEKKGSIYLFVLVCGLCLCSLWSVT